LPLRPSSRVDPQLFACGLFASGTIADVPKSEKRGPGRPPAAKSAQTRGRILRAARDVFSEMGFQAATFQEIATRADLTRPAINHYYPSKRALYDHVVAETNAAVIAAGIREAENEPTFAGRLRVFLRSAVHPAGVDRSAAAFLISSVFDVHRNPELNGDESSALQHTRAFATSVVRDGIAAGELRADLDVAAGAEMLVATVWGLGFYAEFLGEDDTLTSVTDQFVGLLNGGDWQPAR